jgi:replicative DNA helicase
MDSIIDYLTGKGLQVFNAAGQEVTIHCLWCQPGHGGAKGKGKLYVNRESGAFDCKVCGTHGGLRMLMEHFGDELDREVTYIAGGNPTHKTQFLAKYCEQAADLLTRNDEMMTYLFERGLRPETLMDYQIGYVPRGFGGSSQILADMRIADPKVSNATAQVTGMQTEDGREFCSGKITIPYLVRGNVVQIRAKDPKAKYFTPAGQPVRLFNSDVLRDAEYVIVTEGEFDALMLQQALAAGDARARAVAVVGIPGTQSWPEGERFPEYFEHAKRVYIGFDPDGAGRPAAAKLRDALGSKARIIELPSEVMVDVDGKEVRCDWSEYLVDAGPKHPFGGHTWRDVLTLVDQAESVGKRMFTMHEAQSAWRRDRHDTPGLKTGYPTLDAIIRPGLKPGNLVIPLAKTGTGKSIWLANLAWNMRMNRGMICTLENTKEEFTEILMRLMRFDYPLASSQELGDHLPHLAIVDENRLGTEDFATLVAEYKEQYGDSPEFMMIDYLGYYARGMRGNGQYEKTTNGVMQLKAEGKNHRLCVIAPAQVNRGADEGRPLDLDDARDSGAVEETADFLMSLYRPARAGGSGTQTGVDGDMQLGLLKSRRGGSGRVVKLAASMASLRIVDATDTKGRTRIEMENEAILKGQTYEAILREQRNVAMGSAQGTLSLVGA